MSKKELLNEQNKIEETLKKCENRLKKLDKQIKCLNLLSNDIDDNEQPMPLYFNIITNKNLEREKSKKYTKKLLNILKKRSCKIYFNNITIKKEVVEEIETPSLEYDNIPSLEYDNIPSLEYDNIPSLEYDNIPSLEYA